MGTTMRIHSFILDNQRKVGSHPALVCAASELAFVFPFIPEPQT